MKEDRLLSQKPRLTTRDSARWAKEPGSGVDAVQVPRVESPTPLSPVGPHKGRLSYAIRNQYEITRTAYAQHACKNYFLAQTRVLQQHDHREGS